MTKQGFGFLEANATWLWTGIISGFNGDHIQTSARSKERLPDRRPARHGRIGDWYHRTSDYNTLADVKVDGFQSRVFAALSIPRWNKD